MRSAYYYYTNTINYHRKTAYWMALNDPIFELGNAMGLWDGEVYQGLGYI